MLDTERDQHSSTGEARTVRRTAVAATTAAVAGLASTYLLPGLLGGEQAFDVGGFLIGTVITLGLAGVLFGTVVPRALRSSEGNRPGTVGLVTSVFAFLSLAIFWLGAPLVVAGAGLVLGRHGRERHGRRGMATAAVGISIFVVVATLVVLANDVLGLYGLGVQPPE